MNPDCTCGKNGKSFKNPEDCYHNAGCPWLKHKDLEFYCRQHGSTLAECILCEEEFSWPKYPWWGGLNWPGVRSVINDPVCGKCFSEWVYNAEEIRKLLTTLVIR